MFTQEQIDDFQETIDSLKGGLEDLELQLTQMRKALGGKAKKPLVVVDPDLDKVTAGWVKAGGKIGRKKKFTSNLKLA